VARFSTRGLDARHHCALKTGLPSGLPAIAFGSCIGFCAGRQLLSGLESRFSNCLCRFLRDGPY
jgi:hypothetical protein